MPHAETLIVGAGLAGAMAALFLSADRDVVVLEAAVPAAGASGTAAGLANPMMGRKAKPVWLADEALAALHEALARCQHPQLFRKGGVLRPAFNPNEAVAFTAAASARPDLATWLTPPEAAAAFPMVHAPEGALHVTAGGAVDLTALVNAALAQVERNGGQVHSGVAVATWGEAAGRAWVQTASGVRWTAAHVVLALGAGFARFEALQQLRLHRIKGQVVRVVRPAGWPALPHLAGRGYVAMDAEVLTLGSTYEHAFTHLQPTEAATKEILEKTCRLLPALAKAQVADTAAGIRVTVPGIRLPMLGPLPGHPRVWVFNGLGAKGLLTAPLLARRLPEALQNPAGLPEAVSVRHHT